MSSSIHTCMILIVIRWFLHQWERLHSSRTISHGAMSESSEEEEDTEDEVEFEDDLEYLRFLDRCKALKT